MKTRRPTLPTLICLGLAFIAVAMTRPCFYAMALDTAREKQGYGREPCKRAWILTARYRDLRSDLQGCLAIRSRVLRRPKFGADLVRVSQIDSRETLAVINTNDCTAVEIPLGVARFGGDFRSDPNPQQRIGDYIESLGSNQHFLVSKTFA